MLEERQRAAGEKVDGGLVSRNEEQERHGQQLVLAKPAPPFLSLDQRTHEIILRQDPPAFGHLLQVAYECQGSAREHGYRAVEALFRSQQPTAILALSDQPALGTIEWITERRISVPQEDTPSAGQLATHLVVWGSTSPNRERSLSLQRPPLYARGLSHPLRQSLTSHAVAVLIESVGVSWREVELGLFLALEIIAVVVACRCRGSGGLGRLRGLGNSRRWLSAFGRCLLRCGGFRLGRLVRSYNSYNVGDQVVAHHELPLTVHLDHLLCYGRVDLRVRHDVAVRIVERTRYLEHRPTRALPKLREVVEAHVPFGPLGFV